jgi:hypothetical protein
MPFTQPSATDGNPAVAEMVRQGIQKAREKLIDLSLRNGMLNYRHSESSSRHVRVVHELPSTVVDCLASEKSIDLIPLPPVETIPRDEDTDAFRAALKRPRPSTPNGSLQKTLFVSWWEGELDHGKLHANLNKEIDPSDLKTAVATG